MPPMAAIFAIGSGSLAVPQLSEDFSSAARDFVLSRMVDERKTSLSRKQISDLSLHLRINAPMFYRDSTMS